MYFMQKKKRKKDHTQAKFFQAIKFDENCIKPSQEVSVAALVSAFSC